MVRKFAEVRPLGAGEQETACRGTSETHRRVGTTRSPHSTVRSSQGAKANKQTITKFWNQNEKPLPLPVILRAFYIGRQRRNVYRVQLKDHKARQGRVG